MIRPVWGTVGTGVHVVVDGRELLRSVPATAVNIRRRLFREHGPVAATLLLVEEFVPAEDGEGRLPIEYKCHAFGGIIAAVQVIEHAGPRTGIQRYYTPRWEPFPDVMDTNYPLAPPRQPPRCLDEMLDAATAALAGDRHIHAHRFLRQCCGRRVQRVLVDATGADASLHALLR